MTTFGLPKSNKGAKGKAIFFNQVVDALSTTVSSDTATAIEILTQTAYDALETPSATTVKGAVGATDVYRGANLATKICFFSRRDVANNPSLRGTFKDIVVALPGNAPGDILQTPDGDYVLPFVNNAYFKYFIPKF